MGSVDMSENLYHDDETMLKVARVLENFGVDPIDVIAELQNEGILFRERNRD